MEVRLPPIEDHYELVPSHHIRGSACNSTNVDQYMLTNAYEKLAYCPLTPTMLPAYEALRHIIPAIAIVSFIPFIELIAWTCRVCNPVHYHVIAGSYLASSVAIMITSLIGGILCNATSDYRKTHPRDDDFWEKRYCLPGSVLISSHIVSYASITAAAVFGMTGVMLGMTRAFRCSPDPQFNHCSSNNFFEIYGDQVALVLGISCAFLHVGSSLISQIAFGLAETCGRKKDKTSSSMWEKTSSCFESI